MSIFICTLFFILLFVFLWWLSKRNEEKEQTLKKVEKSMSNSQEDLNVTTERNLNERHNKTQCIEVDFILYEIRENTKNTKKILFWVKFWSIFTIICVGVYLLYFVAITLETLLWDNNRF